MQNSNFWGAPESERTGFVLRYSPFFYPWNNDEEIQDVVKVLEMEGMTKSIKSNKHDDDKNGLRWMSYPRRIQNMSEMAMKSTKRLLKKSAKILQKKSAKILRKSSAKKIRHLRKKFLQSYLKILY